MTTTTLAKTRSVPSGSVWARNPRALRIEATIPTKMEILFSRRSSPTWRNREATIASVREAVTNLVPSVDINIGTRTGPADLSSLLMFLGDGVRVRSVSGRLQTIA